MTSTSLTPLRANFLFLWIAATSALCIGLLLNQFREEPLPLLYQNREARLQAATQRLSSAEAAPAMPSRMPDTAGEKGTQTLPEFLSMEEFSAFVENKRGLVFDARPEIFHRLGHVPGAISLPRDDFENAYTALKDRLEANKAQPIVVYCSSSSCEDSKLVRDSLRSLGYTQVAVFNGGWAEWTAAGKPEETNS